MVKLTRVKSGDPLRAVKSAVEKSNIHIAVEIAAQAKLFAPVQYGQLRNSISAANLKTNMLLNDNPGERGERLDTKGLKGDEAYVGANVAHAAANEYGINQVAQPFMRPAKEMVVEGKKAEQIIVEYGREAMVRELK